MVGEFSINNIYYGVPPGLPKPSVKCAKKLLKFFKKYQLISDQNNIPRVEPNPDNHDSSIDYIIEI